MPDPVEENQATAPVEDGPVASAPSEQEVWDQAIADLDPAAPPRNPNDPVNMEEKSQTEEPAELSAPETETQGNEENLGESQEAPKDDKTAELEAKIKALEARLEQATEKPAPEPEPEPVVEEEPFEMTQEVKDLLEYTNGLDKLIKHEAKSIAREILEDYKKQESRARAEAEKQQELTQKESTYWEDVGNWFSGEYPELTLQQVRESPDFNDWLALRKNWVDAQLNSTGRYDTSGAKAVYERYVKENLPSSQKQQQEETPDNAKRLAAARSPSARSTTQSGSAAPTDVWSEEVGRLKTGNVARQYI